MDRLEKWKILEKLYDMVQEHGYDYGIATDVYRIDTFLIQDGKSGRRYEVIVKPLEE